MPLKERIDVHSHYFPPAYEALLRRHDREILDGAPKPKWSVESQLNEMQQLNIRYAVLSLSSPHLHMGDRGEATETARACNEYGAALARQYPKQFGVMASLPLPEIEASIQEIRYCRDVLQVTGFALQTHFCGIYLGSAELEPVIQELNRQKTVAVVHPTVPSAVPEGVASVLPAAVMDYFFDTTRAVTNMILNGTIHKYTNIHWIIPHAGAFLPVLSDRLDTLSHALRLGDELDVMGDLHRLYYDLAGMSMPKQYALLREVTDIDHIFYGSDKPFTPQSLALRLAQRMENELIPDDAQKIYWDNALNFFPKARRE